MPELRCKDGGCKKMTLDEAKIILINRGFVEINGDQVFDGNKWRNAIAVISKWLEQEPCEDCISRQAVIKLLSYDWANRPAHKAVESIRNLPSVTPKEKTGYWIDHSDEGYVECPFCDHATTCDDNIDELHYCFYCGARMVEPQESEARNDKQRAYRDLR